MFPITIVISEQFPSKKTIVTSEMTFIYFQQVENRYLAKVRRQSVVIDGFVWELHNLYTPGDAMNP
jgi:hypothetical protein